MTSFYIVVALMAIIFVACQLSVIRAFRRYILARSSKLRLRSQSAIFVVLFVLNISLAFFSMKSGWYSADSQIQKVLAVSFFTYIGVTFSLGILLAILRSVYLSGSLAMAGYRMLLILVSGDLGGVDNRKNRPVEANVSMGGQPSTAKDKSAETMDHVKGSADSGGLTRPFHAAVPKNPEKSGLREKWARITASMTLLVFSGFGLYGVFEAYSEPIIERFNMSDPKLNGIERPVKLIHVTDIHYGMFYNRQDLRKLVSEINSIEGDAVFFTGDIFHSSLTDVESSPEVFRQLNARRFGNFVVMGNHEFYTGEKRSITAFEQAGLTILRDEWTTLSDGTANIHVAGLDDPRKNWLWGHQFPAFQNLMLKAPTQPGYRILLCHRPAVFPIASQNGFDLILAGHTHGGQVVVPLPSSDKGWSLASVVSEFTHGWYELDGSRMYLNRGAGLTFIPWRINCAPEISVFTLSGS